MREMITETLQKALEKLIQDRYQLKAKPQLVAADPKFGDYSSNVAFELAGQLKRSPQEIASELADSFDHTDVAGVKAASGYLNLTLQQDYWLQQLRAVKSGFARSDLGKGQKVQVEFISANPTGPTTIGNARGGFLGDVIARVYDTLGYDVTREYYFNDAGTQISKLVESVKASAGVVQVKDEDLQYRGDYIQDLAKEFKDDLSSKSDTELAKLLTDTILKRYIEPAVVKMGIKFDVWFNESDLLADGRLDDVIKRLEAKDLVHQREGAVWLDTKKLGVAREERVLIKSNGDPTYLAPDIAYHDDLFGQRGFDRSITVLGADHIDQFPSVRAATLALHPKAVMDMAPHQWFRLIKDGKEVKVSKRLGQFVTIDALIDEVGMPVARFLTIMRDPNSHMDFDLDLAKEQSQKNPYYYVMYSYVRAQSILSKAKDQGLQPGTVSMLAGPSKQLAVKMLALPEVISQVATDFGVHRLAYYGQELAKLFHDYYESVPILKSKPDVATSELALVQQFCQLMESYFDVLGIEPLAKM